MAVFDLAPAIRKQEPASNDLCRVRLGVCLSHSRSLSVQYSPVRDTQFFMSAAASDIQGGGRGAPASSCRKQGPDDSARLLRGPMTWRFHGFGEAFSQNRVTT